MKSITLLEFGNDKEPTRHQFIRHESDIFTLLVKIEKESTEFSIEIEEGDISLFGLQGDDTALKLNQPVPLQKTDYKIHLDTPYTGMHYFNLDMSNESKPILRVKKGLDTSANEGSTLDQFLSSQLPVSIEIGRSVMYIDDVLTMGQGSIIELDRMVGEELEVYVGDIPVATAEMVTMGEEFAIRLTKILPVVGEIANDFDIEKGE